PPLRIPEGARFTVTRRFGQATSLDNRAARTRSRASRHTASGKPTTLKPGRPWPTWTSTVTGRPRAPSSVADRIVASTTYLLDDFDERRAEPVPRPRRRWP